MTRLGRCLNRRSDVDRFRLGTRAGRPGDGGGEKRRWLKFNLDVVEEIVAALRSLYEAVRRKLRRVGTIMTLPCVDGERSIWGTMMVGETTKRACAQHGQ